MRTLAIYRAAPVAARQAATAAGRARNAAIVDLYVPPILVRLSQQQESE